MSRLFGRQLKTIPKPNRASTADRLTTPVRIAIDGDGTSDSYLFDGSRSFNINFTLNDVNTEIGTFGTSQLVPRITVNAKGLITDVEEVEIAVGYTYTPLTNGDKINPELVFFQGDVIVVKVPLA